MARREMWLAYAMLLPTLLVVLFIVLGPLLANFWISLKPVRLADLRPASLFVNERMRGSLETPGDSATVSYRLRNSSQEKPIGAAGFTDTFPAALLAINLDQRCTLIAQQLSCLVGDVSGKYRDKIDIKVQLGSTPIASGDAITSSYLRKTKATNFGIASNVLTSNEFTLTNFSRIFSSSEFWSILRVSLYYTIFGTLGALLLGLFTALLLNSTFTGRGILRGLFLFPYVAPVIAVAFTWVTLLDPFSGTLNSILLQMGALDEPINFLGQRAVELKFLVLHSNFQWR